MAAADLKAGDVLLLSATSPPLTRRISAVLPPSKKEKGWIRFSMEGQVSKDQPWAIQPHVIVRVVNES